MTQSKKYDYAVEYQENGWNAQIKRRVSSKKSVISRQQDGFSSETEAEAWGKEQLAKFLLNQKEKNKRRSAK